MKIGTFINHGTIIEIESVQTMNLRVDRGEICIGEKDLKDGVSSHDAEAEPDLEHFSEAQQKASGIKMHPDVVLSLMREMQPLFTQKVDWLSFYSVLLRRRWVDENVSAWCRLVEDLFDVKLDSRTMATDLKNLGSADYTLWTDADKRILRRKQLATDFDTRLTEYFARKRAEVITSLSNNHP